MTETIRYSQIGAEDINLGTGSFEVELADGRHVVLSRLDVGRILSNPALSSPFQLPAYPRLDLPNVTAAGVLARVTDDVGGLWMSAGLDMGWAAINGEMANVKDAVFGAMGDGLTDDTDAINAALATGKVVFMPPGIYVIRSPLELVLDGTMLRGSGIGLTTIYCADGVDFPAAILATARTQISVRDLMVDCNKDRRSGILTTAMSGIHFEDCVESSVVNVLVKNALGHTTLGSGVGINFGGANTRRGMVRDCIIKDCGITGKASDAVYTKGQQNLIVGCVALNCNDTAFVIENSDSSGIVGCTARGCSAGAAITAATIGTFSNNFIDGLTVYDWNAAVSGGIQLGAISGTANLDNTNVSGVIMQRVSGSGPAMNVKQEGGLTTNVLIRNCRIDGAGTGQQGILVRGSNISIMGNSINNVGNRCVQVEVQSSNVQVIGNWLRTAVVGEAISFTDTDDATAMGNVIYGDSINTTNGIKFYGTAQRCHAILNLIQGVTGNLVAADAGTTPRVINPDISGQGGVMFGKDPGPGSEMIGVASNALSQLALNELAPSHDIKWGRPMIEFGIDATAPAYIDGSQVGWLKVVTSEGTLRLLPLVNPL